MRKLLFAVSPHASGRRETEITGWLSKSSTLMLLRSSTLAAPEPAEPEAELLAVATAPAAEVSAAAGLGVSSASAARKPVIAAASSTAQRPPRADRPNAATATAEKECENMLKIGKS